MGSWLCLISKVANGRITGRIEKNKNNKSFIILGDSALQLRLPSNIEMYIVKGRYCYVALQV